jgi:hypothetical protein
MRTHVKTEEKKKDYNSLNRERKEEENLHASRKLSVDQKKINRRLKIL